MVKHGVHRYPVPKYPVEIKYEVPLVPVTSIGRRNIPNEYLGSWGKGNISHRTLAQLGPIRSGPVLSGIVRYGLVWYYENTCECGELNLYFSPSAGG